MHVFFAAIPKLPKSSIPVSLRNGREKSTEVRGGGGGAERLLVFNAVYTFDPIISQHYH